MSDYTIKGTLKLETKEALAAIESIKKAMGSVSTSSSSAATSTFSGVKQGATTAKQELKSLDEAYSEYAAKRLRQESLLARYKSDPAVIKAQQELNKLKTTGVGLSKEATQAEMLKANILKSQNAIITKMAAKQAGGAQHSPLTRQTAMDSRAFADLQNSAEKAQKKQDDLKKSTGALKEEYTSLDQAIGVVQRGLIGMFAFGALAGLTGFLKESFRLSAELEDLKTGLVHVSREYDIAGSSIAAAMKRASQGILSEAEAIKRVNQGALLGGKELAEAMPELFNIVRTNARAMGIDTGYALESMTIGLGRLSARWLDNLGIVIDTRGAYRELANDLNKTVGELTDTERRIALVNEVISKYKVPDAEGLKTSSEQMQATASSWQDFMAAFGRNLIPGGVGAAAISESVLDAATAGLILEENIGSSVTAFSNLSREMGKTTDEGRKFAGVVEELRVVQDMFGTPKPGNYMRTMINALVDMDAASRELIKAGLPEYYQAIINQLNKTETLDLSLRDDDLYPTTYFEDIDGQLGRVQKSADGFKVKMHDSGVALKDVRDFSRETAYVIDELRNRLERTADPHTRLALISAAINEIERSAGDAIDDVATLVETLASAGERALKGGVWDSAEQLGNFGAALRIRAEKEAYQREQELEQERETQKLESELAKRQREYESYYNKIQGYAEQAALTGLEVKASDFTDKDRLDAPLEAVRRLRDIANIGTKSPWYEVFEVPDDVVKSGEYAIRKWAKELADRGADLRDISLIDKDAFLRELGEIETAKREREAVLSQLTQWAMEAGFNPTQAKAYAGAYVGEPTAEGIAQGLTEGLKETGLGSQVGSILQASIEKSQDEYKAAGAAMADKVRIGIEKYFQDHKLVIPVALATTGVNVDVEPISWDRGDV